ncbi:MAG TPA: HAMP domain-containing sensor histidine kinase [Acidimicrobiales bacterium]
MRRRLLVTYLAVTCGVLLVVLVPLGVTYRGRQVDDGRASLQREAFLVAAFAEDTLENPSPDVDQAALARSVDRATGTRHDRLIVVDRRGRIVVNRGQGSTPTSLRRLSDAARRGGVRSAVQHGRLIVAVPIASNGHVYGAVVLTTSLNQIDRRVRSYWLNLAAIGAAALVVVVGTGITLARSVSRPLDELSRVAHELGGGDLAVRARTDAGPAEVRELARVFNRTADQLADLVRAEAEFVGDASHELRTPLTALRLRLENLSSEMASAPDLDAQADDLAAALDEVERLSRLVDGLLALARADASSGRADRAVDLRSIADLRAESWSPLATEMGIGLRVEGPPVDALAGEDRVGQIIDNLVANALDASSSGGEVIIRVEASGSKALLHVIDEGRGLRPEDRRRAFDRFWRAGPPEPSTGHGPEVAPETTLGGNGLGLAIVARLAAAEGGSCRLEEAPHTGIDAVLELLLAPHRRGDPTSRSRSSIG